jgi:hypothetical protein
MDAIGTAMNFIRKIKNWGVGRGMHSRLALDAAAFGSDVAFLPIALNAPGRKKGGIRQEADRQG